MKDDMFNDITKCVVHKIQRVRGSYYTLRIPKMKQITLESIKEREEVDFRHLEDLYEEVQVVEDPK